MSSLQVCRIYGHVGVHPHQSLQTVHHRVRHPWFYYLSRGSFQQSNNLDQTILHSVISAWLDNLSIGRISFFLPTSCKDFHPYLDVERSPVQLGDVPVQCSIFPECGLVVSDLNFTRPNGLSLSLRTVLGGASVPTDHVGQMPLS